jgi:hypothetical protein
VKAASFYIKFFISQAVASTTGLVCQIPDLQRTTAIIIWTSGIATPRHLFHHTTCSFSASFAHGIRVIL